MLEFMNIDVDKDGKQCLTRSMDVRRQLHLGSVEEIQGKLELLIKVAYRNKDPRTQDLMTLRRELVQMRRHLEMLELRESQRIPDVRTLSQPGGSGSGGSGAAAVTPSAPPFSYSSDSLSSSSSEYSDEEEEPGSGDPNDIRNSIASLIMPVEKVEELRVSLMMGVTPGASAQPTTPFSNVKSAAAIGELLPITKAISMCEEPFECPICMDDVEPDEAAVLSCGHKLCEDVCCVVWSVLCAF
jgi:hypothetical protein